MIRTNAQFRRILVVALAAAAGAPAVASGQLPQQWEPPRGHMSRDALTASLAELEQVAVSLAHTSRDRALAQSEAAIIRTRLQEGDFQVGDRIHLIVEGEETLTDTFAVANGRVLNLPGLAPISVAGVLRFELQDHLRRELGRFLREPVVHVRSMIRVSITGEVTTQGFYVVPTDVVISDALMLAGGPTAEAKLDGMKIQRGSSVIWTAEAMTRAINEGRTIDQLNLRAGDQVIVPSRRSGAMSLLQSMSLVVPIVTLVAALLL